MVQVPDLHGTLTTAHRFAYNGAVTKRLKAKACLHWDRS